MRDKVEFFGDSAEDEEVGFIFKKGFKEEYFAERFEKFKAGLIDLVNKVTIESFCSNDMCLWDFPLKSVFEDEYDFYIDSDNFGMETLDSFIRHAEEDKPYYICATVDYHM